jgi:tryptophanyl-tRNA synthetase
MLDAPRGVLSEPLKCSQVATTAGDTEQTSEERERILTGVRPTGPLHLGHYVGALENWVRLQDGYECFFLLADYQVADYADRLDVIRSAIMDIALDWLAVGLDPSRSHFVVESQVPERAELAQWLSWYLPLARLQRNPTLKSELADLELRTVPVAFFTYPVLQAANILLPRAQLVPVGEDQLPHIEMTRELARRLNGLCDPLFPEPRALVGRVPRLVGIDGQSKMSKSRGNAIYLKDDPATVTRKVMRMFTDPSRLRATDPGHVEGNPVFQYHDAFNLDTAQVQELKERYVVGKVGDVEVKRQLVDALDRFLEPIRDRRRQFESQPDLVWAALAEGSRHVRQVGQQTMEQLRAALRIDVGQHSAT